MFQYKDYTIEQEKDNVVLYKVEQVAVIEEGTAGRGKGRGTPTGEFKPQKNRKGYYSTFKGAFGSMIDHLSLEGENIQDLIALVERIEKVKTEGIQNLIVPDAIGTAEEKEENHEDVITE